MGTCGGSSGASRMPSAAAAALFFLFVDVALLASAALLSAARPVHKQLTCYKPQVDLRPAPFHNSSGQRPRLIRPSLQVGICIFLARQRWLGFNPPHAFKTTPHGSIVPERGPKTSPPPHVWLRSLKKVGLDCAIAAVIFCSQHRPCVSRGSLTL